MYTHNMSYWYIDSDTESNQFEPNKFENIIIVYNFVDEKNEIKPNEIVQK